MRPVGCVCVCVEWWGWKVQLEATFFFVTEGPG
jgi:hypothetical protein